MWKNLRNYTNNRKKRQFGYNFIFADYVGNRERDKKENETFGAATHMNVSQFEHEN